jgi:uncharacterized Zn-finger protein
MESYPKFHNEVGVPIVRIGCREFKCIEDKPPQDHPHIYLKIGAATLGIGYAPKGMMKGYVAIPIRLPTGELTGYIGITEGKVPMEFHLSNVVTFPKKSA